MTELRLIEGARRRPVHVPAHERKHRPGREALQGQYRLCARPLAHVLDLLEILEQPRLMEQIVRGPQPAPVLPRDLVDGLGHCCILGEALDTEDFGTPCAWNALNGEMRDCRARDYYQAGGRCATVYGKRPPAQAAGVIA